MFLRAVALVVTLAMLGVANQCSPNSKLADNTGQSDKVSTPGEEKSSANSRYESMRTALKAELAKLGMRSLDESKPGVGTEFRVLVGFGVLYPRCFVRIKQNGQQEAFYVAAKMTGNKAVMNEKRQVVPAKTALAAPASGWDEFNRFLYDQGIESRIKLSLDEKLTSDPDEELIFLELKSGSEYSMVFFTPKTESNDGKRAWTICKKIEQEFGITLGCEHASSAH